VSELPGVRASGLTTGSDLHGAAPGPLAAVSPVVYRSLTPPAAGRATIPTADCGESEPEPARRQQSACCKTIPNLQFQDDRIVGAGSLGLSDHAGVLRGLIQARVPLGDWKQRLMQDPTRLMEAYLANTQPLGYNARVA
jgi:hypothetical protein